MLEVEGSSEPPRVTVYIAKFSTWLYILIMNDLSITIVPLLVKLGDKTWTQSFSLRLVLSPSLKEVSLIAETGGGTQQEDISLCMPIVHSPPWKYSLTENFSIKSLSKTKMAKCPLKPQVSPKSICTSVYIEMGLYREVVLWVPRHSQCQGNAHDPLVLILHFSHMSFGK